MTVSTIGSVAEFDTNGVATNYPFYFKFLVNEDLVVTYVDPLGVSSILNLGTHYTVSGAGNDQGGSITTTSALAGPGQLIVSREMEAFQQTSLRNQGKFLAETHEDVFDKLMMLVQQGFAIFARALTRPFGRDYFFAENRRIASVKDPVDMQDAATKKWSLTTIGDILGGITGNPNVASNVFYQGPDGLPYNVQNLSSKTNASWGARLIGYIRNAVGAVGRTQADFNGERYSPMDFGCKGDGVTNDSANFRKALDAVAASGWLDCPYWADFYIPEVIYIPQRIPTDGVAGQGIVINGNNCTFTGNGSNIIFESGTGTKSTVALGGATNWGLGNELPTTIHYNSRILNCNFRKCKTPLKLWNWLHGCVIAGCWATDFTDQGIIAKRSFYLHQRDNQWRPFRADRSALMPIMDYDQANNTQSFVNVHCSGIKPNGTWSGVGLSLDGGVQGLMLGPGGLSLEGCTIGLWLKSTIYSLAVTGTYFELCGTGIQSTGANLLHVIVDANEFEDCPIDISVDNWVGGYYGSANKNEGSVTFGTGCVHEVHYPPQYLSQSAHTNWIKAPPNWTVPGGCQVRRNDMIFNNSGTGLSTVFFRNEPDSSGNTGVAPMKYTGDCFNIGGIVPYCTPTITPGVLILDTKIAWNPDLAAVRFDLKVEHSQVDVISGVLTCDNRIRLDAGNPAGITVVASNGVGVSSGRLRFTLSGFNVGTGITNFSGKIRII